MLCPLADLKAVFFDFDGLIVNTEPLHYQAYRLAMQQNDLPFLWDFSTFTSIAHTSSTGLSQMMISAFPHFFKTKSWKQLYEEKGHCYKKLLEERRLEWMPGALPVLNCVKQSNVFYCVVTHSTREQIELCQHHLPLLKQIPLWITREDYANPKPAPDGYLKAVELSNLQGKMVGFEDALRGIVSLQNAHIDPILICPRTHPQMGKNSKGDYLHFESFEPVLKKWKQGI